MSQHNLLVSMYQNDGLVSGRQCDAAAGSAFGGHELGVHRGDRR